MRKHLTNFFKFLKELFTKFFEGQAFNYSAAIAFYTIFSLPAVLIIIIYIANTTFDDQFVQSQLFDQIQAMLGTDSTQQVKNAVENFDVSGTGILMNIFGISLLIFSATTVFVAIQDGLNNMWNVKPKPKRNYLKLLKDRLMSFGIIISFGFIMMVFLLIDTLLAIISKYLNENFSDVFFYIAKGINFGLSALVVMLIFSLIFKFLPDTNLKWRQTWRGSLITTILFIAGKFLINYYLERTPFTSTYGVAGSLVAVLLWIYYSSLLLFLGASFIVTHTQWYGNEVRPSKYAVKIESREIKED